MPGKNRTGTKLIAGSSAPIYHAPPQNFTKPYPVVKKRVNYRNKDTWESICYWLDPLAIISLFLTGDSWMQHVMPDFRYLKWDNAIRYPITRKFQHITELDLLDCDIIPSPQLISSVHMLKIWMQYKHYHTYHKELSSLTSLTVIFNTDTNLSIENQLCNVWRTCPTSITRLSLIFPSTDQDFNINVTPLDWCGKGNLCDLELRFSNDTVNYPISGDLLLHLPCSLTRLAMLAELDAIFFLPRLLTSLDVIFVIDDLFNTSVDYTLLPQSLTYLKIRFRLRLPLYSQDGNEKVVFSDLFMLKRALSQHLLELREIDLLCKDVQDIAILYPSFPLRMIVNSHSIIRTGVLLEEPDAVDIHHLSVVDVFEKLLRMGIISFTEISKLSPKVTQNCMIRQLHRNHLTKVTSDLYHISLNDLPEFPLHNITYLEVYNIKHTEQVLCLLNHSNGKVLSTLILRGLFKVKLITILRHLCKKIKGKTRSTRQWIGNTEEPFPELQYLTLDFMAGRKDWALPSEEYHDVLVLPQNLKSCVIIAVSKFDNLRFPTTLSNLQLTGISVNISWIIPLTQLLNLEMSIQSDMLETLIDSIRARLQYLTVQLFTDYQSPKGLARVVIPLNQIPYVARASLFYFSKQRKNCKIHLKGLLGTRDISYT